MGAEPGRLASFFFDRNLGKRVPRSLAERGWRVEIHDDHFGYDTSDEQIMASIGQAGWTFVTQDKRIRYRSAERQALIDAGLRTFAITSSANLSAAETVTVLELAEAAIFEMVSHEPGPFLCGVVKDGSLHRFAL